MIDVGAVEQWWELSRRYAPLREISIGFLKPIGYCFIFSQIEKLSGVKRVLEFGHGFNPSLFRQLGDAHEVHGIDDYQALPYFPEAKEWDRNYQAFVAGLPKGHFQRGLLAKGKNNFPDNSFDVVCSVSVLEELSHPDLADVISEAHRVLRPGGHFINSFDFIEGSDGVLNNYLRMQVEGGFCFEDPCDRAINLSRRDLAFEDQWTVMKYYNITQPDMGRKWHGNWCTFLTASVSGAAAGGLRKGFLRGLFFRRKDLPIVTFR